MDQTWLRFSREMLDTERIQAIEEGRDISSVLKEFDALAAQEPIDEARGNLLLDKVQTLPYRSDYAYQEPSDLEGIKALWQTGYQKSVPTQKELEERIHGAWLGRVCGCFLGKVCEGWRRPTMEGYLTGSGQWPLTRYISNDAPQDVLDTYKLNKKHGTWINNLDYMPEDDDTNYTVSGLEIIRQSGRDFSPDSVASFWTCNIPILRVCTAERVAYRNFCNGILPPESASYRNPYREWIGAQIRADFFGYVNPGDPYTAAEYGWRDASISHIKNGIYGEMWSAAINAAALACTTVKEVLEAGFAVIPPKSRLTEALKRTIGWYDAGKTYDEVVAFIHEEWDENTAHGWCHTISNAMLVTVALLWGEMDYSRTICMAVQACFDTDCNGATAGSVLGGLIGASRIPEQWSEPLHDTLETGVQGYHRVKISDMAKLTVEMVLNGTK